jgi:A/G-specific adenine glycosylase
VRQVVTNRGGEIPSDPEELRVLPGVGEYTASAVASIAFGAPVAAVDGNVRRVLARLADDPNPPAVRQRQWATRLLVHEDPGAFNQAMMELGALVCTPRAPRCGDCPVTKYCRARASGTQEERPRARARREIPHATEAVVAIVGESSGSVFVLVRKRPPEGLLGGLWELPGIEVGEGGKAGRAARRFAGGLLQAGGWKQGSRRLGRGTRLAPLDHVFTHRRIRYLPFLYRPEHLGAPERAPEPLRWVAAAEARQLPFPAAQRTLLDRVDGALGEGIFSHRQRD